MLLSISDLGTLKKDLTIIHAQSLRQLQAKSLAMDLTM